MRRSLLALLLVLSVSVFSQPAVTSITPASAVRGATISITGSGFNATASDNIVYFGAVRATVTSASSNLLAVTVPTGATYGIVKVTDRNTGLTGTSAQAFVPTFSTAPADGTIAIKNGFNAGGTTPVRTVTADMDNDGKPDVVVVNQGSNNIAVLRNTSSPMHISFETPVTMSTMPAPTSVAAGDLNGDGKMDIVVGNYSSDSLSVFFNTSTGTVISFAARRDVWVSHGVSALAIQDIDKDGKQDIIATNSDANKVLILPNTTTTGTFTYGTIQYLATGSGAVALAIGDLDGDDKADIAVANETGNTLSIFHNACSAGSFTFTGNITVNTDNNPSAIVAGDINGDGKLDLVFSKSNGRSAVFINNSTPGSLVFPATGAYAYEVSNIVNGSVRMSLADFNGDGKLDITETSGPYSGGGMKQNSSNGSTVSFGPFSFGGQLPNPSADVNAADIDGDGRPDMVLPVSASNSLSVFRNTTTGTAPQITSFAPMSVSSGNNITINGVNLDEDIQSVWLGGVSIPSFQVLSSTQMQAFVYDAASGDLRVTNQAGVSSLPGFIFLTPPAISSVVPTSLAPGQPFTINGSQFLGATGVKISGTAVTSFQVLSNTLITAVTGNGTPGNVVSVTTAGGTGSYTITGQTTAPLVTSFTPLQATAGDTIRITGSNFVNITGITLGGTSVASFNVLSSTSISAVVGAGSTGTLTVTGSAGSASLNGFTYIQPAVAPVVSSFTPTSASTGTTISITGNYFAGITGVAFGGTSAASFTVLSPTFMTAVIGSGATGNLSVTGSAGSGSLTGFTFISPGASPVITSFSPTTAMPGEIVTIYGSNLSGALAVTFGNTPVANFSVISSNMISTITGNGGSGDVKVTTPNGTASKGGFVFRSQTTSYPVIETISPLTAGAGATLTITGTGLTNVLSVTLGGTPVASFRSLSSTLLTVVVGNGTSGAVKLVTTAGSADNGGFIFIVPDIIKGDTVFCAGSSRTLSLISNSNPDAGSTLQWYRNDTLIAGANLTVYIAKTAGKYKLVRITSGGQSFSSNTLNVTVMPEKFASFTITGDSVQCLNNNRFTFSSTTTQTGVTLQRWRFSDTASNTSALADSSVHYSKAGVYKVRLIVTTNLGCTDTATRLVTVNADPVFGINQPAAVCNMTGTASVNIRASVAGTDSSLAFTYWKDSVTATLLANPDTVTQSGNYYVKATNIAGCSMVKSVTVKINPLPSVASITGDTSVCVGAIAQLQNTTPGGVWSSTATGILSVDSTGKVKGLSAGTASIVYTYTNSATGCTNNAVKTIVVNTSPLTGKPVVADYAADTVVCFPGTITLTSKDAFDKYLWSNGATTKSVTLSTNESVTLKVGSNAGNCYSQPSVTITTHKNVTPPPSITKVNDTLVSSASLAFKWMFNNKYTGDTTMKIPVGARGIYNVSTTIDKVCWNTSNDYLVIIDQTPAARKAFDLSVYPNPSNGVFNVQVKFDRSVSALVKLTIVDQSGVTRWTGKKLLFFDRSIKIPVNTVLSHGVYTLKVEVSGEINTQQIVIL